MIEQLRRFLGSRLGRAVAICFTLLALGWAAATTVSYFHSDTPSSAFSRMFICTETQKPFSHKLEVGETVPVYSPYSGKNTGVPAEACYWTADGGAKSEPTWVLLNELAGKEGPTFCPDCGRLVVGHNPAPRPGAKPPPTPSEYFAALGSNPPR
ncbi:MAG: hypothetical protein ABR964_03115 [Tepidisphaeraceae bacterium]|jgi:hypothetical protein